MKSNKWYTVLVTIEADTIVKNILTREVRKCLNNYFFHTMNMVRFKFCFSVIYFRFLFFLLLFFSQGTLAQHARFQSGIILGLDYIGTRFLNQPLRQYNLINDSYPNAQPLLKTGFRYGFYAVIGILEGLQISPEFSIAVANSAAANFGSTLEIKYTTTNIRLNINHYFLKHVKAGQGSYLENNLFTQYVFSYSDYSVVIVENGQPALGRMGELVDFQSAGLFFGVGVGYDIFLSEAISISPVFKLIWFPKVTFNDYAYIITKTDDFPASNRGSIWNFQLGLRMAYTVKPRFRLCPISECEVSLHHRHREFGSRLFRGSFLDRPQNARIGEKYKRVRRRLTIPFLSKLFGKKGQLKQEEAVYPILPPVDKRE